MSQFVWSVCLTAMGLGSLWLLAHNRREGWIVGLADQVLWVVYATMTESYAFYASALAYGVIYYKGLVASKEKRRAE